jgi:tetratricopeptide (TPR) repeat protein
MRTNRSLWTNLALSIAAPMVFFIISECLLFLVGIQPLSLTDDPYVGYSGSQPLFIQEVGVDGKPVMVTNPVKLSHFNAQKFTLAKPANTYRIFSIGGSTAYGHPWRDPVSFSGWLRALLPYADSTRRWEVINAGGISYASYREANLIAELIQYQPDLFLVYSGHNEFLEERTYRKTVGIPSIIRKLSAGMDHTRTYSALRVLARKLQAEKPTMSGMAGDKSPENTGPNLASEVDDVLAKTIGPTSYTRNDTLRQDVLDHYGVSLARMAELAHSVGAQVLFITTPVNEKDCSPFKSESTPGLTDSAKAKVKGWMQSGSEQKQSPLIALKYFDSALSLDSRNASLAYAAGQMALEAKLYPEAKHYFEQALNEDICPLRALTAMRKIVLETAKSQQMPVLDFTAILEDKTLRESGHRILGEPDFVDHVHLTIEDYRLMALSIIEKFREMGTLEQKNALSDSSVKIVTDSIMAKMGSRELGEGLHNLAKVVNWAGKHEDAARIAERALAVDSMGLEAIWSSLFVGTAMERQGKEELAIPHYRRAVKLDTNNMETRQYLAEALMRQGSHQEAAEEFTRILSVNPKEARAMVGLGKIAQAKGNIPEAINYYAKALSIDPKLSDAQLGLSKLLGSFGSEP